MDQSQKIQESGTIDDLADSLLTEILIRLPMKSVHQHKSVSKRWFSLISSPHFAQQFKRLWESRSGCSTASRYSFVFQYLISEDKCETIGIESTESSFKSHIPFPKFSNMEQERLKYPFLLGSSNGLVLCLTASHEGWTVYHVWNPLTGKRVSLPALPDHDGCTHAGFLCNDIVQESSVLTAEFKVFLIAIKHARSEAAVFQIRMFFSEIDSDWTELTVPCPQDFVMVYSTPVVFYDGMLYSFVGDRVAEKIIAIDSYKKPTKHNLIDLPSDIGGIGATIGISQGRIQVSMRSYLIHSFPITFFVWELEDSSTSSWSLKHKVLITYSELGLKLPFFRLRGHPSLHINAIDGDFLAITLDQKHSLLYNMKNKTVEVVFTSKDEDHIWVHDCFPFYLPWWPTSIPKLKPKEGNRSLHERVRKIFLSNWMYEYLSICRK